MSCQTVSNGLAAVGSGLELFALGRIVLRPWLLPKLKWLWSQVVRPVRWLRRRLPFRRRSKPVTVSLSPAGAVSTAGHLHAWTAGPVDVPDKPLDERFDLLLSRVENVERWVAEVEGKLDRQGRELREHASEEAQSAYGRMASRLAQMER